MGDAVMFDQLQGEQRIELLHEDYGGTEGMHRQGIAHGGRVVEGGGGQVNRVLIERTQGKHRVERHAFVRAALWRLTENPFWTAGGTGTVKHQSALPFLGDALGGKLADNLLVAAPALSATVKHQLMRTLRD
ncbi:hypothetical protein D3C77_560610 [compost metagenome]